MRKMKDSKVDWLGEVPEPWGIGRIGQLYTERREKVSDTEYQPLSVTMKGILPQLSTAAKTDVHDDRKLVRKGDFAINSRSDRRGSCGISPYDGSVSLINTILTPREKMHPIYYDWLFHASMFSDEFYKWGHGIVDDLWTTNWNDMKRIAVPMPPFEEQQRIAAFLDSECARIDSIIEQTRASIEEYKKLKQAVITQSVTKGIRPGRKMKDSGIEWIGEINSEYSLQKIKYFISDYKAGPFGSALITGNLLDDGSILVYTPEHVSKQSDNIPNNLFLPESRREEMQKFFVEAGHIVFPIVGSLGKAMYITPEMKEGIINQRLAKFRINEKVVDIDFFMYVFAKGDFYKQFLEINSRGAIIVNLTKEIVYNMPFPLPSLSEQKEIVSFLDVKTKEIELLIEKKELYLSELESLKKALIYEYVTGKKEVPQ